MAENKNIQKRKTADNHAFSKLDFYRRCAALMKSKDKNTSETIKSEFEKLLDIDSPYVFYLDDRGWCVNTEVAMELLEKAIGNIA